jgi:lysophospholipase L1-like esterase
VFSGLAQQHPSFLVHGERGYRTTYQRPPTPLQPGTYAAVLGGSSVHRGSPGVPLDREFPAIATSVSKRTVTNLGAPGLDSFDLVAITKELAALPEGQGKPQVIVVYTGHNDFGNARFHARYGTVAAGLSIRLQAALEHLQLYAQLSLLLRPVQGVTKRSTPEAEAGLAALSDSAWDTVARHLAQNLAQIAFIAKSADMRVVFIVPVSDLLVRPSDSICDDTRCPQGLYDRGAHLLEQGDPTGAAKWFREARDADRLALRAPTATAEAMKRLATDDPWVSVVDATQGLPRHRGADVVASGMFTDPIHLSLAGHKALGQLLGEHLARGPIE